MKPKMLCWNCVKIYILSGVLTHSISARRMICARPTMLPECLLLILTCYSRPNHHHRELGLDGALTRNISMP